MMNIKVAASFSKDKVQEIIDSFGQAGKTYWEKRNTIKVFEVDGDKWNVKSFQIPHLVNRFAYKYVRKSKARRSFEHAEILLKKRVLTPEPIAYVEYSDPLGLKNSYYVSKNLSYDFAFSDLFEEQFPDRINILNQFTEFTFKLHENDIHHFDHSKGNTIICRKGKGLYDFYLIDLNRMKFEKMNYQARIDNFNRLSLTTEMMEIIGKKYASLMHLEEKQVVEDIKLSCQKFKEFYLRKARWKKRIRL